MSSWSHVRSSYDQVAGKYEDRFRDELAGKEGDRHLLATLAQSVADPVLEIGCGPGQIGGFVRERGRRVLGLDLSPEMARRAAARLDGALVADMRDLPIRSGGIGGIVAFYSIIHLRRPELRDTFREFFRALRPGGRILLSAHEGDDEIELTEFIGEPVPMAATFFGLDELTTALGAAGFDITNAVRREPYSSEGSTIRLYVEACKPESDPDGQTTES